MQNNIEKDPVCGMEVQIKNSSVSSEDEGTAYYFCSPTCKADFDKDPKRYTEKKVA